MRQHCISVVGFVALLFSPLFLGLGAQTITINPGDSSIGLGAPTVTINPGYISIGVKGTVQYSAVVTGLANAGVTWSVSGPAATSGTITAAGLYTAPAAIPIIPVTIVALASDRKTFGIVYVNIAPPGPPVTNVSPNPLPAGNYMVTVMGSGFTPGSVVLAGGVTYSPTFISSTTLRVYGYQATAGPIVFQVANNGTLYGTPFSVTSVAPQTISPFAATVELGATQQFTSAGATHWAATVGTITATGFYTAPAALPPSGTVTVTATGPGGSASATVYLTNHAPQAISPTSASVNLGATQQFTSTGATKWTATAGIITPTGLYIAPVGVPSSYTVTVTATDNTSIKTKFHARLTIK
jgi:hypothetical protein